MATLFLLTATAAGSLLPHTLLDSVMVQTMFNPDVLSFWEAVLGTGTGWR